MERPKHPRDNYWSGWNRVYTKRITLESTKKFCNDLSAFLDKEGFADHGYKLEDSVPLLIIYGVNRKIRREVAQNVADHTKLPIYYGRRIADAVTNAERDLVLIIPFEYEPHNEDDPIEEWCKSHGIRYAQPRERR